jgi:hypothetical protein
MSFWSTIIGGIITQKIGELKGNCRFELIHICEVKYTNGSKY